MIQGWDQTVVNGAQVFYSKTFHISDPTNPEEAGKLGLVNAASHLLGAIACLFIHQLNRIFRDRRGVVLFTCIVSVVSCLCQSFPSSWKGLFAARLTLGLGIGPKSATIPIYASECTPAQLRGALVMMWQMWTAFGLMCGYLAGAIFWHLGDQDCRDEGDIALSNSVLNVGWMVLPIIPILYIYTLPESPRFLLQAAIRATEQERRAEYVRDAFASLIKLNKTKLQASRELFVIYRSLKEEPDDPWYSTVKELWTNRRTRNALVASVITMFLQQFCGVNVLAYYSTSALEPLKAFDSKPYYESLGLGVVNVIFTFPAFLLMDTFGRRSLLLVTFPLLAASQFVIAFARSGRQPNTTLSVIGMYLFFAFYSVAEGPVPFVYASESMPLYHRDYGMGIVTCIGWLFNFLLGVTWPRFLIVFHHCGAFAWYGSWCIIGWFLIFFFVRETKGMKLEAMGAVFKAPTSLHLDYARKELYWAWKRCLKPAKQFDKPSFFQMVEDWDLQQRKSQTESQTTSTGQNESFTPDTNNGTAGRHTFDAINEPSHGSRPT
ncbi:general substrate transporter [Viridothelium virens]|uniref:General substrate transporter n=1 Tax=Viridothelium virens TaxID=1048519 RepID=A0A6A6GTD5_VIRVR|nr:general substrate transporter [Viridothelium virens]